ncbi:MAG: transposase [Candidatus Aenigmarchaeota archaeon]|nr:transposase [Candidatus Aenigmarchaeota archaeon]
MNRMFKYRLYPSKVQQKTIDRHLELCRRMYNELLAIKIETYEQTGVSLSKYQLTTCVPHLKNEKPEYKEVYGQTVRMAADRIDKAFKSMFRRIKAGEKAGFPRFKGKNAVKSLCYPQNGQGAFHLKQKGKLRASKIGSMNIKLHRPLEGKIKNLIIKKTPTNKYYAFFCCEVEIEPRQRAYKKAIGLDVGLKSFLATSEGQFVSSPEYYRKSEQRLVMLQRRFSRKKKGSKNRTKARFIVAMHHEHTANQRTDFLHKLSSNLTYDYSFIAVEDLNIQGMTKNHCLAKSISDAGWGTFITQLQYKAEQAGGVVSKVNRFFPSSKTCSSCGAIQDMPLKKRTYKCGECGLKIDRDTNAAKNILNSSLERTDGMSGINACGDVGLPTPMKQEAHQIGG